jgi:hypothetical protein
MLRSGEPSIIVLVVDDEADDELVAAVAREDHVPSENFGGLWGTGQKDGNWLVVFGLIQRGGGLERAWYTDNIHRELLDAILDVPHLVCVMPKEIAGDATTLEAMIPRMGGSIMVGVQHRSPQVAQVLAERDAQR